MLRVWENLSVVLGEFVVFLEERVNCGGIIILFEFCISFEFLRGNYYLF